MQSRSYTEIRDELKTGDLVLFSGNSFISSIIKLGTLSRWSHIGMVLRMDEYDFLAMWESTTLSNVTDLETDQVVKGVAIVALSERIKKYDGEVAIRQLNKNLPDDAITSLMQLRKELKGVPYEGSRWELFKAAYDGPFGKNEREDLSTIFCSELTGEALQRVHLLSPRINSNELVPADFGSGGGLVDLCYGDEIMVKWNPQEDIKP